MRDDLTKLEQRWGMALQNAGFGVWDLDVEKQLVSYSTQWKALLGYDAVDEPDPTTTWRERVHPEDLPGMLAALTAHSMGESDFYEFEFRLRAADASFRWVMSRGRVVERTAAGVASRLVGTLTDLTERRQLEQLRAERDRAEAESRAKSEFVSRMSHELRTPLNAVLGFAQLLTHQLGDDDSLDEQRLHVAHIEQAGWQLLTMINDVLDLANVEAGTMAVEMATVALEPILHELCERLGDAAPGRGIRIVMRGSAAEARVAADAGRLAQALAHLIGNAVKFSRAGGTVFVDVERVAAGWQIAIVDAGVGIPAAQMQHLFEPFNRRGRPAARGDGVGVGLLLSRCLLESMGSRLTVESSEGAGCRCEVVLAEATRESPSTMAPTAESESIRR